MFMEKPDGKGAFKLGTSPWGCGAPARRWVLGGVTAVALQVRGRYSAECLHSRRERKRKAFNAGKAFPCVLQPCAPKLVKAMLRCPFPWKMK